MKNSLHREFIIEDSVYNASLVVLEPDHFRIDFEPISYLSNKTQKPVYAKISDGELICRVVDVLFYKGKLYDQAKSFIDDYLSSRN